MDDTKVKAITEWPMPTTVCGIHSFLSLANFYHCFIKDYAKLAKLLMLQSFFLIVPSCYSFILNVYLLGEVDTFTPIPHIFSFIPHLLFVSSTFPWT